MGEAIQRDRESGQKTAGAKPEKDRSGEVKGVSERASGRVSKRSGGGIRMYGNGNTESIQTSRNNAKKKTKRYREQDPVKAAKYQEQIRDIPPERIAYIDETGIDTYLYREYAYSPKGEAVCDLISGRKYQRTGIVAAQMCGEIIEPFQYNGTMDSVLFEHWFEQCLLPALPPQSVIVMDNAAFHRKSRLYSCVQNTGHTLIFLPPYSPNLNPIEHFWSWLKRKLRKILHLFHSFNDALFECFQVC